MYIAKSVTLLLAYALIGAARSDSGKRKLLSSMADPDDPLTIERMANLRRIFEFIRASPDFKPLTLSIVSSNPRGNIADFVSRLMASDAIDGFQLSTEDLDNRSIEEKWQSRADLTWIFLIEDLYTLRSFVELRRKFWTPTNQYVLVFYARQGSVSWRTIFQILWRRYNVCRVMVTLLQDDFRWFLKYLPFESIHGQFGRVQRAYVAYEGSANLSHASADDSPVAARNDALRLTKESRIFEKFYKDMNGYPINVTAFRSLTMRLNYTEGKTKKPRLSGLDAEMLRSFEAGLNCKFHLNVIEDVNYRDPFELSLRYIDEGLTEIVVTSFFTKDYENFEEKQFTSCTYQDKLCFIAPEARLVPKAYMPVVPFPRKLWTILAIYNFAITILWTLVKHWSRLVRSPRSNSETVRRRASSASSSSSFASLGKTVTLTARNGVPPKSDDSEDQRAALERWTMKATRNEPPEIQPQLMGLFNLAIFSCYPLKGGDTTAQRAFLVGTLFFSILISGLYQSRLVSSFNKPYSYRQIDTVRDVINSNYSLVTKYSNLRNIFAHPASSLTDQRILEKMRVIASNTSSYKLVAYQNVITLGRLLSLKFEDLTRYHDEEGRRLLHVVNECPATYTLSYVVRKRTPYLERLDAIIIRLQQTGIVHLWLDNMKFTSDNVNRRFQVFQMDRKRKLSLEHYSLTFLSLFVGLVCSFFIFLCEVYWAKRKRTCRPIRPAVATLACLLNDRKNSQTTDLPKIKVSEEPRVKEKKK